MSRTFLLLVFGSCALIAAAVTVILESDDLFSAAPESGPALATSGEAPAVTDNKRDRLPVIARAPAEDGGSRFDFTPGRFADPLRQSFAADSPLFAPGPTYNAPIAIPQSGALQKAKPAKTPPQKNYSLLSDAQIAAIRSRLKLTPQQEPYWPAVEASLRKIAKTMHERRLASASPPLDPESTEVGELRTAAMPLLTQLREDQKREVRALARIIGLEAVASQL